MGDFLQFFINASAQFLSKLGSQAVLGNATLLGLILAFMVMGCVIRSFALKGR